MIPYPTTPRVAIVGSTASGKSAVAMAVAEELDNVELVSVDSMQVYRGMDIGTAKPTAAEQARVRHHLVDLVDPSEEFTVAEFQTAFRGALGDIEARGARALLVGGTGLYHRAVIDDLDIPGEWPAIRANLEQQADQALEPLYAQLVDLDPVAAERIEPGNRRRVVRALEVCLGSQRRFSSFGPGLDTYPDTGIVQIGLRWPRDVIRQRIAERVDLMMGDGFLAEVEQLLAGGMSRTARQALGYRELIDYLEGRWGLDEAIEQIVVRTGQFAVRQERWFRRDPRIQWIDVTSDPVAEAAPAVRFALGENGRSTGWN